MKDINNEHQVIFEDNDGKNRICYFKDILFVFVENNELYLDINFNNTINYILNKKSKISMKNMLVKVENGSLVPPEDNVWQFILGTDKLCNTQLKKLAYVSLNSLFSKMELEKELKSHLLKIRVFRSYEEAYRWITEK